MPLSRCGLGFARERLHFCVSSDLAQKDKGFPLRPLPGGNPG